MPCVSNIADFLLLGCWCEWEVAERKRLQLNPTVPAMSLMLSSFSDSLYPIALSTRDWNQTLCLFTEHLTLNIENYYYVWEESSLILQWINESYFPIFWGLCKILLKIFILSKKWTCLLKILLVILQNQTLRMITLYWVTLVHISFNLIFLKPQHYQTI